MTGYLLIMKNIINDSNEQPKWCRKPECRPDDILDGALIEFLRDKIERRVYCKHKIPFR